MWRTTSKNKKIHTDLWESIVTTQQTAVKHDLHEQAASATLCMKRLRRLT